MGVTGEGRGGGKGREEGKKMYNEIITIKIIIKTKVPSTFLTGQ